MKKIIFKITSTILVAFISTASYSQTVDFVEKNLELEISAEKQQTFFLQISVAGNVTTPSGAMTLSLSRNDNPAVCQLSVTSFTVTPLVTVIEIPFTLYRGKARETGDTATINFTDIYTGMVRTLHIYILNKKEKTQDDDKKSDGADRNRLMLLNAYNFDFGNTSLKSNYVGHLNFFVPALSKDKKWGFNSGIMKINYGQKDSTNETGRAYPENILISPFDTIKPGLKYVREINTYQSETRNTVWSFYVQPIYELTSKTSSQHIYVHGHMELLASKWTLISTIKNLSRDTAVLPQNFQALVFRSNLNTSNVYTVNSLSGYFGAGFTFDLKPWNGGSFLFQPTWGITSNNPSPSSVDISTGLPSSYIKSRNAIRSIHGFYLVRTLYRHVLSKDATVVVGMDIRGFLPFYNPQYAAYVGLNIGLDSILGLIGGKKGEE